MVKKPAKTAAVDTASGVDSFPSDSSEALRLASKVAERWPDICDTIVFILRRASDANNASRLSLSEGGKVRAAESAKEYAVTACQILHQLDLQLTQHAPAIIGHANKLHAASAGVCDAVGDHFASAHEAALSIAQSLFFDAWRLVDEMRFMNAWGRKSKQEWAPVFEAVKEPEKLVQLVAVGSKWCDFKSSDASRIRSLLQLERAKLWNTKNDGSTDLDQKVWSKFRSPSEWLSLLTNSYPLSTETFRKMRKEGKHQIFLRSKPGSNKNNVSLHLDDLKQLQYHGD